MTKEAMFFRSKRIWYTVADFVSDGRADALGGPIDRRVVGHGALAPDARQRFRQMGRVDAALSRGPDATTLCLPVRLVCRDDVLCVVVPAGRCLDYTKEEMRSFLPKVPKWIDGPVRALNKSKLFAGFIIIVLNISSKFVTIKLSKSMEAYLRHTFSRDVLIFAMAWMGTREIYTALVITSMFMLCSNYLFNEESSFCCLPEGFTQYHLSLEEEKDKKEQEKDKKDNDKKEQEKDKTDKDMLPRT